MNATDARVVGSMHAVAPASATHAPEELSHVD